MKVCLHKMHVKTESSYSFRYFVPLTIPSDNKKNTVVTSDGPDTIYEHCKTCTQYWIAIFTPNLTQYGLQYSGSVQCVLQYASSRLYVDQEVSSSHKYPSLLPNFLLYVKESGEIIVLLRWHCPLTCGVKFQIIQNFSSTS